MEKNIIIAGCRNYSNYKEAKEFILSCISEYKKTDRLTILSGGCKGADLLGEHFAKEKGFSIKYYPADWKKFGKAAGPIRNKKMVEDCHGVICFWDGKSKGTASLLQFAQKAGKPIKIKYI